jgi:hypothetical protein
MNNLKSHLLQKLALGALPVFLISSALNANVLSVNLVEFLNDTQQIDADETFGIGTLFGVDTTVGNWTNTKATALAGLPWNTGAASTVDFASTQPNGQGSFNAAYGDTPLIGGLDDYTTTVNPTTVSFSNLNANFAAGYFAVVYLTGFNTNTGASISDGTSTYYFQTLNPPVAPVTLVQTMDTTAPTAAGDAPFAQYAVFGTDIAPLTADAITFTLDTLFGGGAGVGGVQLVAAVPEPSVMALLAGLGALGLVAYRRRRG